MAEFDRVLGDRPNQKSAPGDPAVPASALLDIVVPGGRATEAGARQDVSVTLRYLDAWLRGNGAAAIDNLMEDAATAEISRSQLWQWRRHGTVLDDGRPFDDVGTPGSATMSSTGSGATRAGSPRPPRSSTGSS